MCKKRRAHTQVKCYQQMVHSLLAFVSHVCVREYVFLLAGWASGCCCCRIHYNSSFSLLFFFFCFVLAQHLNTLVIALIMCTQQHSTNNITQHNSIVHCTQTRKHDEEKKKKSNYKNCFQQWLMNKKHLLQHLLCICSSYCFYFTDVEYSLPYMPPPHLSPLPSYHHHHLKNNMFCCC